VRSEGLDLDALPGLSLDALRDHWRARYGVPPLLRSRDLLARLLAFRLQAEREGGLTAETRALLRRSAARQPEGLSLGEGAVLRKVYRGRTHEVVVLRDGFLLEGQRYRSLSEAATALTGSRRNGPRFFGLRSEGAAS